MELLDDEQVRDRIRGCLNSHEWWAIFDLETNHLQDLEETFYAGEANADFHLFVGPQLPGFHVAFAKKSRLSATALAEWMSNENASDIQLTEADLRQRDIFAFVSKDVAVTPEQLVEMMAAFERWLGPIDGPTEWSGDPSLGGVWNIGT